MLPSLLQKLQNETFHSDIHLNKFLMQSEVCGGNRDRCSCLLMLGSALCVIGWLYCFPLFCYPNTERDLNVSSNLAWSYCLLSWYHRGSRDGNWYGCMVKKKKKSSGTKWNLRTGQYLPLQLFRFHQYTLPLVYLKLELNLNIFLLQSGNLHWNMNLKPAQH